MSVQAITLAYAIQGVTPSEKFLLVTLANYADQSLRCWPSQRRLTSDTCLSKRTMVNLFASLEAKGLLVRNHRPRRKDGARDSMLITLLFHSAAIAPRDPDQGATAALAKVQNMQNHGATIAPKPSENHQMNRQRAREACDADASSRALTPEEIKNGFADLVAMLGASKRQPAPRRASITQHQLANSLRMPK